MNQPAESDCINIIKPGLIAGFFAFKPAFISSMQAGFFWAEQRPMLKYPAASNKAGLSVTKLKRLIYGVLSWCRFNRRRSPLSVGQPDSS